MLQSINDLKKGFITLIFGANIIKYFFSIAGKHSSLLFQASMRKKSLYNIDFWSQCNKTFLKSLTHTLPYCFKASMI
jgi:hypothetical protein